MSRADQAAARITELSGASATELASALRDFDVRDIAAAIIAAGGGGNGGSQPMQVTSVLFTSDELLAADLNAPLEVVPGVLGKILVPISVLGEIVAGTTPYVGAAALLTIDNPFLTSWDLPALFTTLQLVAVQSFDPIVVATGVNGATGAGLYLAPNPMMTDGDASLRMTVIYAVVTAA